jgi:capsid protein
MATLTAQAVEAARLRADLAEARTREKAARLKGKAIDKALRPAPAESRGFKRNVEGARNGSYGTRTRLGYDRERMAGSPDSHLDPLTHDEVRRECQALARNEVGVRMVCRTAANLIVGRGPKCDAQTDDDKWNDQVEQLWQDWARNHDIDGSGIVDIRARQSLPAWLRSVIRAMLIDGDRGAAKLAGGSLQTYEGERIVSPSGLNISARGGGLAAGAGGSAGIVSGVEMAASGRAIAYHVAPYNTAGMVVKSQTSRIAAEQFIFMANPHMEGSNMARGEPGLTAARKWFDKLSLLDEAVIEAFRVAACFSAIITSANPGLEQQAWAGETVSRGAGDVVSQDHEIEIEPGMVKFAQTGSTVTSLNPSHPSTQYKGFVDHHMQMIGADIGVPLLLATMDASASNFSAFRAAMTLAFRGFGEWHEWISSTILLPLYRWRVAMWIRQGVLPYRPDFAKCEFTYVPPPVLDPKVEVEAMALSVEKLFKSRKQAIAELYGGDLNDLYKQRKIEVDREDELGLKPVVAPGTPGAESQSTEGTEKKAEEGTETDEKTEEAIDLHIERAARAASNGTH